MELHYKISKKMLSLMALGVLLVCFSCIMFVCDPLKMIITKLLDLSDGTIFFSLWSVPPYEILLKIYCFNITNAEEFLNGTDEKLNFTEIGPYVYREILTNNNVTFNDDDGTMTFFPNREFAFDALRSVGDPKHDRMITLNLPLVGLQAYLKDSSFFTNIAFSTLARTLGSKAISNLTVDEYLWGYEDKLVRAAHQFVPDWIDFERFGIFERLLSRDNNNVVTTVKDTAKYHSKTEYLLTEEERFSKFHVVRWNDSPGLKEWGYDAKTPNKTKKCQLIEGTYDGTVFPTDLRKNRTLILYRKAFCRPVPLEYVGEITSPHGYPSYAYKLADWMFDTPATRPENECFCKDGNCKKGLQDIGTCYYGIPITLSQPHFLNAEHQLDDFNGLSPDEQQHGSVCYIQPDLGVPLGGNMRIQINLNVGQTKYNPQTRPFNGLNVPLFWVEITTAGLPSLVTILLTLVCNVLPVVVELAKYALGLVGVAMVSGAAACVLMNSKMPLPRGISLTANDYTSIPLINLQVEYSKCGRDGMIQDDRDDI